MATAYFGGGCFWCTESTFKMLKGVNKVTPGYAGGDLPNPTYDQVCGGQTGHAEMVMVEFDPELISYQDLLTVFFVAHNPSTLNAQGPDRGEQYRSIILITSEDQAKTARDFIAAYNRENPGAPAVTEIKPFEIFYEAEEYHHDYYKKNPASAYCLMNINPKIDKLKKKFSELIIDRN